MRGIIILIFLLLLSLLWWAQCLYVFSFILCYDLVKLKWLSPLKNKKDETSEIIHNLLSFTNLEYRGTMIQILDFPILNIVFFPAQHMPPFSNTTS